MSAEPLRRRVAKLLGQALAPLLGLAVLAGSVVVGVDHPDVRGWFRNFTYDHLQRLAPRVYEDAPVRIVDLDDESLAKLGQWPWPRTRVAELVERLRAAGAAAIAFDIVFAEPDRTSPTLVAMNWPDAPGLREFLKELPDHDLVLAQAVKGGRVVTGFSFIEGSNGSTSADQPAPLLKARFPRFGSDPLKYIANDNSAAVTNLRPIEEAAAGNGAFNFIPDEDGVIRRVPLLFRMHDKLYPSLAIEALRVALGAPNISVKSVDKDSDSVGGAGYAGIYQVVVGRVPVVTDAEGSVWLYFTKPVPERYIPAWKVVGAEATNRDFDGKIVFVGTSAAGLRDLRFSPFGILPGVEIHAQLIEQILGQSYLQRPDWADAGEVVFLAGVSIVVIVLVSWLGPGWSALVAATGIGGALGLSFYAFTHERLLFEPVYPAATILVIFLTTSIVQHVQSERQGRWIRQAFSSYVSPNLVEHLIEHPDELKLGGERRECSFVLTDLAGFTTVVERSDPASLIHLMNAYLDGMVGIAFEHEGTLDRIVGDAVAVMFSAPVEQPDHARRAVACALAMDKFAQAFKKEKNAEGVPLGNTRIGVHSGQVIVGNFGGQHSFDYRALGDAINTTARLETVNRHLGTRICVSSVIAGHVPDFAGRPVGRLVLKGKSEPIEAFEPVAPEEAASERVVAYCAAYALLDQESPAAQAAFAELAKRWPDDGLAAFQLDRLAQGETGATIIMTEK
jgi:adenylate cyclase